MASEAETPDLAAIYNRVLERHRNLSLAVSSLYGTAAPPATPLLQNPLQGSEPSYRGSSSPPVQGARDLDAVIRDLLLDASRNGGGGFRRLPPASKASIEAMPIVEVGADCGIEECVICLVEWSEGEFVKEMPCKHRFHGGCVEKWLGVHGSCPVCRFQMPAEELENVSDEEQGRRRVETGLFGSFSVGGSSSTSPDSNGSSSSISADTEIRD
ncbi:E3 ubiquitin-protein ligase MPSR1 [Linum grandiflorum]